MFAGEAQVVHLSSGENAAMFVNAEFAGGTTNTSKFSLYVSPYLVANRGGRYTKHIYIGSQRIVSKLGDLKSYGADPRRIEYAGSESDGPKVDYKAKYALQQQVIKDNFAHFDVPYNGADNNDYVDGKGFSEKDGSLKGAMLKAASLKDNFQQGDDYEQYQYFYHPDHLGSSSFITNTDGEVVQHIEYVPYGEVFIEERNNVWNTPYLFNAKEFDEETGLYYYGARYYDSRLSMWYGVDALAEKYPNMGGYVYCAGNPVKFVDPDGKKVKPYGELSLAIIKNTLPKDAQQYIKLNDEGYIDLDVMKQYNGDSENFRSLSTLVRDDREIEVTTLEKTDFIYNGELHTETFAPVGKDDFFVDSEFKSCSGNTTGEYGNLGVTYMPTNGEKGKSDAKNPILIHININPSLSPLGAAETFSHEGFGHALIYVETNGDRTQAVHHFDNSKETNKTLIDKSIRARKETIKNMER